MSRTINARNIVAGMEIRCSQVYFVESVHADDDEVRVSVSGYAYPMTFYPYSRVEVVSGEDKGDYLV